MKVQVELSFILDEEPEDFKTVQEIQSRSVYIWLDKRGYLEVNDPWKTFTRKSITQIESPHGVMEIWTSDSDLNDPPNDVDDMWIENYKSISKKSHTIEWHQSINILKLTWNQTIETIQQKKVITPIISSLEYFNLDFPDFPSILQPRI